MISVKTVFKYWIIASLALLALFDCTGYKISHSDYDKSADFNRYKYFGWRPDLDTSNNPHDNFAFRYWIMKDFSKLMGKHGYILRPDSSEILFELKIFNNEREESVICGYSRSFNGIRIYDPYDNPDKCYSPLYPGYSRYSMFRNYSYTYDTQKLRYTQNCITINAIDKRKNKLIWTATSYVDMYEYDQIPSNPNPIARELVTKFPVKRSDRSSHRSKKT